MGPGLARGLKKGLRTIAQVIAAGGLTALVAAIAGGLSPQASALLLGAFTAAVAFSQNWLEGSGKVRTLLPSPSLVIGPASEAVATVDAVADEVGEIGGDVLDTGGDIVGEIIGQLDKEE